MEEIKFPIYKFNAKWNQDNFQDNSSSYYMMYKEEPTKGQLNKELQDYKLKWEQRQIIDGHPITEWLDISYEYLEHESWCSGMFHHMTYNQFETDEEIEHSFYKFVDRKMKQNKKNGHGITEQYHYDKNRPFYCLMGAEDEWVWKICRCEECKKLGKITINH